MKKILFISHDATLTGAPILLCNLIELLKGEVKYSIKVIVKNGYGPYLSEFEQICDVITWKEQIFETRYNRFLKKITGKTVRKERKIQSWINDADIIFSNTITNGDFLKHFKFDSEQKIISYIHELNFATNFYTNQEDLSYVKSLTNEFLVPSDAVKQHLMHNLEIPSLIIKRLNYYIPLKDYVDENIVKDTSSFTVGLVGTLDWRKGADILTIVVNSFFKKYPDSNLTFIWQGVEENSTEAKRIIYELKKLNLDSRIIFNSSKKNIHNFYSTIDLLLLLSKEDPYPLVVLEAASYHKPCICFDKSGGASEFTGNSAGDIIPYLDIEILTDVIYSYYADRDKCKIKGEKAHEKYLAEHFNKNLILSQFANAL